MNSPQVTIRPATPAQKEIEFVPFVANSPKRLVMSIDGPPDSGKTHFCLTAPGPISVQNLDLGLEGVAEGILSDNPEKVIYDFPYAIPHSASLPGSSFTAMPDAARKVWDEFVRTFRASLVKTRTVVVDTGSEAWNLVRLARLGKLTQVLPVQYTAVNSEFRQLTQLAMTQQDTNVIYTHKMKAIYENDQKTDKFERSGFGDIGHDVQVVLTANRDTTKAGADQYSVVVEKCRLNSSVTGKRFIGSDCCFARVAAAIYPNTTEEFWR